MSMAQRFPIDIQLRDLDAAGVDIACLSGNCRNVKEAQPFDDETAKWVKANPERFIGFAHFPPTGGKEAIEEVDRAVKDLNFKACHIRSLNLQPTEDESKDSTLMRALKHRNFLEGSTSTQAESMEILFT